MPRSYRLSAQASESAMRIKNEKQGQSLLDDISNIQSYEVEDPEDNIIETRSTDCFLEATPEIIKLLSTSKSIIGKISSQIDPLTSGVIQSILDLSPPIFALVNQFSEILIDDFVIKLINLLSDKKIKNPAITKIFDRNLKQTVYDHNISDLKITDTLKIKIPQKMCIDKQVDRELKAKIPLVLPNKKITEIALHDIISDTWIDLKKYVLCAGRPKLFSSYNIKNGSCAATIIVAVADGQLRPGPLCFKETVIDKSRIVQNDYRAD